MLALFNSVYIYFLLYFEEVCIVDVLHNLVIYKFLMLIQL